MSRPAPSCPSCGVAYRDHLGMNGTCARLLQATHRATLQAFRQHWSRGGDGARHDTPEEVRVSTSSTNQGLTLAVADLRTTLRERIRELEAAHTLPRGERLVVEARCAQDVASVALVVLEVLDRLEAVAARLEATAAGAGGSEAEPSPMPGAETSG